MVARQVGPARAYLTTWAVVVLNTLAVACLTAWGATGEAVSSRVGATEQVVPTGSIRLASPSLKHRAPRRPTGRGAGVISRPLSTLRRKELQGPTWATKGPQGRACGGAPFGSLISIASDK